MNQLNGLLSEKSKKPIIINGKLVMEKGSVLLLQREKYHTIFSTSLAGKKETIISNGKEILDQVANDFNEKYLPLFDRSSNSDASLTEYYANVDPFTGAIVMKNELYKQLMDIDNTFHFHDGTIQLQADIGNILNEFIKELVVNYYEIFCVLFNRRLMGSRMPIKIKGHLVAGLFQPLVVSTRYIDCPLQLGEFSWFFNYINGDPICEEQLESIYETTRGLGLTVIAMSDFASKFSTPIMRNLDKRFFLYILYYFLLESLHSGNGDALAKEFGGVHSAVTDATNSSGLKVFYDACLEGFRRCRSSLVLR